MMVDVHFGHSDEVRVWFDEPPLERYASNEELSNIVLSADVREAPRVRNIVVEARQPRHSVSIYGLLGIEIEIADRDDLEIRIGLPRAGERTSVDIEPPWHDRGYYGFPPGYAQEVLNALSDAIVVANATFPGAITVCYAAQTVPGTNLHVLKAMAGLIPTLLYTRTVSESVVFDLFGTERYREIALRSRQGKR